MIVPRTLDDYVTLLRERTPFVHSNIGGDGEFLTITGWRGTNSDGRTSTPEKAEALARCITEPRYTFAGYNPGKPDSDKLANAERWLRERGVNVPIRGHTRIEDPDYGRARINVRWVHKEIISSANARGQLAPFIRALRGRTLLVVASENVTEEFAHDTLGATEIVRVPLRTDWEALDSIEAKVRHLLAVSAPDAVVSWGLGYRAKVLTWRVAPDFPGVTHVDMGACWDPYCGIINRSGYRRPEWSENMRKNLEGAV